MRRFLCIAVTTLATSMAGNSGWACFQTPDARPILGCMPYNFSAPRSWEGSVEETNTLYPEIACYKRASGLHLSLIERLYGQMQAGEDPNAFKPTVDPPDLSGGESYQGFDAKAVRMIKKFTPSFVRAYYPPLFAIKRQFQECIREVSREGCTGEGDCRIVGSIFMGYLPNSNQYPVVDLPNLIEGESACAPDMRMLQGDKACEQLKADNTDTVLEVRAQPSRRSSPRQLFELPEGPEFGQGAVEARDRAGDQGKSLKPAPKDQMRNTSGCPRQNAFVDCRGQSGSAFDGDSKSWVAFGDARLSPSIDALPPPGESVSVLPEREFPTVEQYFQEVLLGGVLGSPNSHPILDAFILGTAAVYDIKTSAEKTARAVLGATTEFVDIQWGTQEKNFLSKRK